MAGLKSFLYGLAPILGLTGAALYERQRALVALGVLKATPGRGPGSGVPLTADNVAAVIISILAAETLSDIDERVAALCDALPQHFTTKLVKNGDDFRLVGIGEWKDRDLPTFKTEVGRTLIGEPLAHGPGRGFAHTIRVSRIWRGQLVTSPSGANPRNFIPAKKLNSISVRNPISLTAEIEEETLGRLILFTRGAFSQLATEKDDQ